MNHHHKTNRVIGIAGGMGPRAGVDLHGKVIDLTPAESDQDHLPVIHVSFSSLVGDRTGFLQDPSLPNPADGIFEVVRTLAAMGAEVIGIPCNTAHGDPIFSALMDKIRDSGLRVRLLHLIEEVVAYLEQYHADIGTVGVLATNGTYQAKIYETPLRRAGFEVMLPDWEIQENKVQAAIYNPNYGIKARSSPISEHARTSLVEAVRHLHLKGAALVLLACTELPLALPERSLHGIPLIDTTGVLARALVREACGDKRDTMSCDGPSFL